MVIRVCHWQKTVRPATHTFQRANAFTAHVFALKTKPHIGHHEERSRLKKFEKTTQSVEMNRQADNIERKAPTRESNHRNKLESTVQELNRRNDIRVLELPRRDSNSSQHESPPNNLRIDKNESSGTFIFINGALETSEGRKPSHHKRQQHVAN